MPLNDTTETLPPGTFDVSGGDSLPPGSFDVSANDSLPPGTFDTSESAPSPASTTLPAMTTAQTGDVGDLLGNYGIVEPKGQEFVNTGGAGHGATTEGQLYNTIAPAGGVLGAVHTAIKYPVKGAINAAAGAMKLADPFGAAYELATNKTVPWRQGIDKASTAINREVEYAMPTEQNAVNTVVGTGADTLTAMATGPLAPVYMAAQSTGRAGELAENRRQAGETVTPRQQIAAEYGSGAIGGATGALNIGGANIGAKLSGEGAAKQIAGRMVGGTVENAAVGPVSTVAENAVVRNTIDPTRQYNEGVEESLLMSPVVGGVTGGMSYLHAQGRKPAAPVERTGEIRPSPEPQPTPQPAPAESQPLRNADQMREGLQPQPDIATAPDPAQAEAEYRRQREIDHDARLTALENRIVEQRANERIRQQEREGANVRPPRPGDQPYGPAARSRVPAPELPQPPEPPNAQTTTEPQPAPQPEPRPAGVPARPAGGNELPDATVPGVRDGSVGEPPSPADGNPPVQDGQAAGGDTVAEGVKAEPSPTASPEPAERQPWEQTRKEYFSDTAAGTPPKRITDPARTPYVTNDGEGVFSVRSAAHGGILGRRGTRAEAEKLANEYFHDDHEKAVRAAIVEGKPVPPEVLADYPDLAPKPLAATSTELAKPSPTPLGNDPRAKVKNSVVIRVRSRQGDELGYVSVKHDGTPEGIMRAAKAAQKKRDIQYYDASHTLSLIGATDESSQIKWVISPNLKHLSEIGTPDAAYTWGDTSQADKLIDRLSPKPPAGAPPVEPPAAAPAVTQAEPTQQPDSPPVVYRPVRDPNSPKNRPTYLVQSKDGTDVIASGLTAKAAGKLAKETNAKSGSVKQKAPVSPDAMGQRKADLQLKIREAAMMNSAQPELSSSHPLAMQVHRGEESPGRMISLESAISHIEQMPEGDPSKMLLHNLRELEKNPRGTKVSKVNTNDVADGTRVVVNDGETFTIDKENDQVKDGIRSDIPEGGLDLYGKKVLPPEEVAAPEGEFAPVTRNRLYPKKFMPDVAQKKINSIREAELLLSHGEKNNGVKLNADERENLKQSIEKMRGELDEMNKLREPGREYAVSDLPEKKVTDKGFYEPTQSQSDKGIFGQDVTKPAGIGEQGSMFHEPVDIPLPKSEKIGSKSANDPENTGKMFGNADADTQSSIAPGPRQLNRRAVKVEQLPSELKPMMQPELYQFAKDLIGGEYPVVAKNLKSAYGQFQSVEGIPELAKIALDPRRLGPFPEQAVATLSHEIGHLVDYLPDATLKRGNLLGRLASLARYVKGTLPGLEATNKEIRKELEGLSFWWRPFDEKNASPQELQYRKSGRELYADAVSALLVSPGDLKDRAPKFFKSFLELLDNKPQVRDRYFEAQNLLNGDSPELAKTRQQNLLGMFGSAQEQWDAAYARKLQAKQTIGNYVFQTLIDKSAPMLRAENTSMKGTVPWSEQRAAKHTMEEYALRTVEMNRFAEDVKRLVEKPLNDAKVDMDTAASIMFLQRIAHGDRGGAGEAAQKELMRMTETATPQEAVAKAKEWLADDSEDGKLDTGTEVELSMLVDAALSGKLNPLGYDPESARQQLSGIKKMIGDEKFNAASDALKQMRRLHSDLTKRAVKEGVYNDVTHATIIEPNAETYAPFAVAKYLGTQIKAGVFKQVGTFNDVANPLHAMMMKSLSLIRLTELNRAKRLSRQSMSEYEPGSFADLGEIRDGKRPRVPDGQELFIELQNGKPHAYAVDPYIAKMFQHSDIGALSRAAAMMNNATYRVFHPLWIGLNPAFQVFNVPRDAVRTYTNAIALHGDESTAKQLVSAFSDIPRMAKAYVKPENVKAAWAKARNQFNPLIRKMNEERAISPSHARAKDSEILDANQYDRFLQQSGVWDSPGSKNRIIRTIGHMLEPIQTFGNFIETLPKVAMYDMATQAGIEGQERAYIVRNYAGTPNSTRRGLTTELTNVVLPYSNVVLQGYRADAEIALNPKTAAGRWARAVLTNYAPKAAMTAAAAGAFGAGLKTMMDDVSEYDKAKYIVIPLGWTTDDKGNKKVAYARLPHNDSDRMPAAILWKLMTGSGASGVSESLGIATGELPSINPWIQIGSKWTSFASGQNPRDDFRGREIIGRDEFKVKGMPAIKQMLEWTAGNFGAPGDFVRSIATWGNDEQGIPTTTSEKIIKMIPGVNRMIRVTARGQVEKEQEIIADEDRDSAEIRLAMPQSVKSASSRLYRLNRLGNENIPPKDQDMRRKLNQWNSGEYRKAVEAMKTVREKERSGAISSSEKDRLWKLIADRLQSRTQALTE